MLLIDQAGKRVRRICDTCHRPVKPDRRKLEVCRSCLAAWDRRAELDRLNRGKRAG